MRGSGAKGGHRGPAPWLSGGHGSDGSHGSPPRGPAAKEVFRLYDAVLQGPLPAGATALRVVRVGGRLLRGSRDRVQDATASQPLAAGARAAAWPQMVMFVRKTMYGGKPVRPRRRRGGRLRPGVSGGLCCSAAGVGVQGRSMHRLHNTHVLAALCWCWCRRTPTGYTCLACLGACLQLAAGLCAPPMPCLQQQIRSSRERTQQQPLTPPCLPYSQQYDSGSPAIPGQLLDHASPSPRVCPTPPPPALWTLDSVVRAGRRQPAAAVHHRPPHTPRRCRRHRRGRQLLPAGAGAAGAVAIGAGGGVGRLPGPVPAFPHRRGGGPRRRGGQGGCAGVEVQEGRSHHEGRWGWGFGGWRLGGMDVAAGGWAPNLQWVGGWERGWRNGSPRVGARQ